MSGTCRVLGVTAAAAVCLFPSAVINGSYQMSLSQTGWLQYALPVGAVLSVIMLGMCPLLLRRAWAKRSVALGFVALILMPALLTFNLGNAIGVSAAVRDRLSGERGAEIARMANLREQIASAREKRSMPALRAKGRTPAMIQAELSAQRTNVRWDATTGCTDATAGKSRSFCSGYSLLKGDLAASLLVQSQDKIIFDFSTQLARAESVSEVVDPQASTIAHVMGLFFDMGTDAPAKVATVFALVFALVLETVAMFGPVVAVEVFSRNGAIVAKPEKRRPRSRQPVSDSVHSFLDARVSRLQGKVMRAGVLYEAYREWCAKDRETPVNLTVFGAAIAAYGIKKETRHKRTTYLNVAERPRPRLVASA